MDKIPPPHFIIGGWGEGLINKNEYMEFSLSTAVSTICMYICCCFLHIIDQYHSGKKLLYPISTKFPHVDDLLTYMYTHQQKETQNLITVVIFYIHLTL